VKSSGKSQNMAKVDNICAKCLVVVEVFQAAPRALAMLLQLLHHTVCPHVSVLHGPLWTLYVTFWRHGKALMNACTAHRGTAMKLDNC